MALVKDKVVTVESLSALHEHNQDTFMTKVSPSGSGTMNFDGDINISGNIIVGNDESGICCIHPKSEKQSRMIRMNSQGNISIGYDLYLEDNGSCFICGNDVEFFMRGRNYRPYYRIGDVIDVHVRTSGYVTNMGTSVFFTIPLTKPIIGEPIIDIVSEKGFILRQGGKYTHSCDGSTTPATYVQPIKYSIDNNFNSGIIVTADFEDTTNVINNDSIGVYLDARITLLDPNEL